MRTPLWSKVALAGHKGRAEWRCCGIIRAASNHDCFIISFRTVLGDRALLSGCQVRFWGCDKLVLKEAVWPPIHVQ